VFSLFAVSFIDNKTKERYRRNPKAATAIVNALEILEIER
jgi:hypothetical protein